MEEKKRIELQQKLKKTLKDKYEYLNFDDTKVLDCFNYAFKFLEEHSPEVLLNDALNNIELEYHFLYGIISEIKKGNQEIHDAVLFKMEHVHDFFLKHKKDLPTSIPKEEQFLLYEKAFEKAINSYYEKASLSRLIAQNLSLVYKQALAKKNEEEKSKDAATEETTKKDSSPENSLYERFKQYKKEWVDLALSLYPSDSSHKSLLVRKFGPNFDGEKALNNLSFMELDRLDKALMVFESRLQLIQNLADLGKTIDEIEKDVKGKNDDKLLQLASSLKKEKKKEDVIFTSKSQILTTHHLSEQQLEDAISYIDSNDERIAYKYTYGIGCKKLDEDQILKIIGITAKDYSALISSIQKKLPSLIEKSKSDQNLLESVHPQGLKQERFKPTITRNKPLPTNLKFPLYFRDHFQFIKDLSEEDFELSLGRRKIYNMKGYEVGQKVYGSDFKGEREAVKLSSNEKQALRCMIHTMEKELNEWKVNARKPAKTSEIKSYFKDNFDSELKIIKEELELALAYQKTHSKVAYELCQQLYGTDFTVGKAEIHLTPQNKVAVRNFISSTRNVILKNREKSLNEKEIEEERIKQQKEKAVKDFKPYFKDNFDSELKITEEELNFALAYQKEYSKVSCQLVQTLYGEDFKHEKSFVPLDFQNKATVRRFIVSTKNIILRNRENGNKFHIFASTFAENFDSELKITEEELNTALVYQKTHSPKAYQFCQLLYGEDFNSTLSNQKLSPTSKTAVKNFIFSINTMIQKNRTKVPKPPKRPRKSYFKGTYFIDEFLRENMSEEEKQTVSTLVFTYLNSHLNLKKIKVAQLLYGESFDQPRKDITLSQQERWNLYQLRDSICTYLGCDDKEKKSNSRRKNSFFDYFYTEIMSEEEKLEISKKVKAYLDQRKTQKMVQDLIVLYGETYDKLNQDATVTKKVNTSFQGLKRDIRTYLENPLKEKKSKTRRKNSFFAYFYTETMSEEEKLEISEKVKTYLDQRKTQKMVQDLIALYGETYDKLNQDVTVTEKVNTSLQGLKREIRTYLENPLKEKKSKTRRKNSFFDYFYTETMSEEEKLEISKKVKIYLNQRKTQKMVQDLIVLYGETYDKLNQDAIVTEKINTSFQGLKRYIRAYLENSTKEKQPEAKKTVVKNDTSEKITKRGRQRKHTFFDYFYQDGMNERTKEKVRAFVIECMDHEENKELVQQIYGEHYDILDPNCSLTLEKRNIFKCLKQKIERKVEHFLNEDPQIETILPQEDQSIEPVEVEELFEEIDESEVEVLEETFESLEEENMSYKDLLVLHGYEHYHDLDSVRIRFNIPEDEFITLCIRLINHTDDREEVIQYILRNHPERLNDILEVEYFYEMASSLTEKEKVVIYLKLLSLTNAAITSSVISLITGVPEDDVENYQIMTKSDEVNAFNEYLKKDNHF